MPVAASRTASPSVPPPRTAVVPPAGRHRRPTDGRTAVRRGVDLLGRIGGLVSLSSLLVLGITLGAAVDGAPAGDVPTTASVVDR